MKATFTLRLATLAATALPLAALADAPFHPSNDEAGTTYHVVPQKAGEAARERAAPAVDANWEYKGGETGWQLRQHAYEFRGGKAIHADRFDHESARPRLDAGRRDADFGGA